MTYYGIIRELNYKTYEFETIGFGEFEVIGTYADNRRCYFRIGDEGETVKQATYTRQAINENGKRYNVFYIECFDKYFNEGLTLTLEEYKEQLKKTITVENAQRFFK
ncbi:MAG: hypothetical protein J6S67_15110 [Methanobrevibacter sp.]|nr:hypothetical protein [Methanobrevibacter sp.]